MNIIEVNNISKSFGSIHVLKNLSLSVKQGDSIAITGESGRGKTSLLYLLSGLDQVNTGTISINQQNITQFTEDQLAKFRSKHMGFIFQHHFLLNDLDALDNALLPLRVTNTLTKENHQEILELFEYFGLLERLHHLPDELSGGEKQRIAIIRALANKSAILFADEPTGALDKENASKLQELLLSLTKKQKRTLILSTHNLEFANSCDYCYTIDELEAANE